MALFSASCVPFLFSFLFNIIFDNKKGMQRRVGKTGPKDMDPLVQKKKFSPFLAFSPFSFIFIKPIHPASYKVENIRGPSCKWAIRDLNVELCTQSL